MKWNDREGRLEPETLEDAEALLQRSMGTGVADREFPAVLLFVVRALRQLGALQVKAP